VSEKKNILLGVTGSIAAYKACGLVSGLREAGFSVNVVMTKDAHHFVTPLSLQSLAGTEVVSDFFSVPGRAKPIHIELAKKADLILVAPASADIIAKLAHGLADDVLTCTALASTAPLLICPAMNEKMYFHKATQANLEILKKRGAVEVAPIKGHLVCMDEGIGHLAEESVILKAVKKYLKA
jgi:phosphopantothenoylcysteine decarboxylase/phosphopantothenate--cysteine ligase